MRCRERGSARMRDIMTSWIPPVVAATICDALCDISSDHVILTHDEHEHDSDDEDEEALSSEEKYQARRNKLTSEQDLLCSCVAMLVISMWLRVHHGFALWAPELGLPYWWTLFAGVIYAIGMMSIRYLFGVVAVGALYIELLTFKPL